MSRTGSDALLGAELGPYRIERLLGAGGMGQVYLAEDTRLGRRVAIKVLPATFAADDERRLRFEREARVIASLSHPHICALYDVGSAPVGPSGAPIEYLVMEHIEGETLADRLRRGPLPLDEAVRYGADIAMALDAAHRQRIVHRDLKPANIMLTLSGVKLLDFGLAKALVPEAEADGDTVALDATAMTGAGAVLGTVPYMSPEQLEGRPADARSDIFALGAVLYEMTSARRAFPGDSAAGVSSAIISSDPPSLGLSPAFDRIVRTCLAKQPERRWQSAHDVGLQLLQIQDGGGDSRATAAPPVTRLLPWAIAASALVLAVAAMLWGRTAVRQPADSDRPGPIMFPLAPPTGHSFSSDAESTGVAMAPDGSTLAFVALDFAAGGTAVWLRSFASDEPRRLAGTEGAQSAFWSPDSKSLAFFSGGKLKRVDIDGGAPIAICNAREGIGQFGTWGRDGTILFASVQGEAIMRVSKSGGTPETLVAPDRASRQNRTAWPSFLPDGKHFLFVVVREDDTGAIMLGSLDGPPRELLPVKSIAQYAAPGYILYRQDETLLARPFDAATGQVTGEPVAIAKEVNGFGSTAIGHFSVSENGTLVYQSHVDEWRLVTMDRSGRMISDLRRPSQYNNLRVSPDGTKVLFDDVDRRLSSRDLYLIDLTRGAETRFTNDPGSEITGGWLPDGSVLYSATRGGAPRLRLRSAVTGSDEALQPNGPEMQMQADVSPDGTWTVFAQRSLRGTFDLYAMSLGDRRVVPFRVTDDNEQFPRFSRDGRFVAYTSNASGSVEVYLAPFPGPGPAHVVSVGGGMLPRWSLSGADLLYVGQQRQMLRVPIRLSPSVQIGKPSELFTSPAGLRLSDFDVLPDGRFIATSLTRRAREQPMTVVVNPLR